MSSAESDNFYVGDKVLLRTENYKELQELFPGLDFIDAEVIRIFFEEPLYELLIFCPDGLTFIRREFYSKDLLPLGGDDVEDE